MPSTVTVISGRRSALTRSATVVAPAPRTMAPASAAASTGTLRFFFIRFPSFPVLIGAIGAPRGVVCFPFHPNNAVEARFIASTQKFFQNPKRSGRRWSASPLRLSFAQADGKRLRPLLLFRQKRHGKILPRIRPPAPAWPALLGPARRISVPARRSHAK